MRPAPVDDHPHCLDLLPNGLLGAFGDSPTSSRMAFCVSALVVLNRGGGLGASASGARSVGATGGLPLITFLECTLQ
jgi:hypothetical protein